MTIEPPLQLVCTEYRARLTHGSLSQPLIVVAENDMGASFEVVLKVRVPDQGAHFGATSLACELICSILARSLNLPVPNYAVVEVPSDFPDVVPDAGIKKLLAANVGENFATVYQHGYSIWIPTIPKSANVLDDLEEVVGFDSVVLNHDRSVSKPNLLVKGEDFLLIDHSLALGHPAFAPNLLMHENYVRKHCSAKALFGKARRYVEPARRWSLEVSDAELARIRSLIPSSWEETPGDLDRIFDFLAKRPVVFSSIIHDLRRILQ